MERGAKIKPEKRSFDYVWKYTHFREYLLALARDESFLETIDNYPNRLELSADWHKLLNKMRRESEDLVERYSVVGVDKDGRRLVLQAIPAVGEPRQVSPTTQEAQKEKAKRQAGVDVFLGDIHSHAEKLSWEYGLSRGEYNHTAAFSAGDCYCMVGKNTQLVLGLVQGNENLFAFRTRESKAEDKLDYLRFKVNKGLSFNKYWYGKSGIIFRKDNKIEKRSVGDGELRIYGSDLRKVNFDIASKHKLILYKGRPGEDLVRIFP
jgi:hypothetical protein